MVDVNPPVFVWLGLLLGIVIGASFAVAVIKLRHAGQVRRENIRPKIPQAAKQILGQLPEAAVLLDSALQAVYANTAATDASSPITDELICAPEFLKEMRQVMDTGAPFLHLPHTDDLTDSTRIRAFRLKRRFVVVIVDDVGHAQRVEAMRRDLIANASHEFKTPVAAISLLSEAISEAADDAETVRSFADSLTQEARRLSLLSRDIIHLSEAQSELEAQHREPVDIVALVQEQVESHRSFAEGRNVALTLTLPRHNQPAIILGRPSALGIAVSNVLTNAIEHSTPGSNVGIGVSVAAHELEVAIADHGPGIPDELQDRVFERFFRTDPARARSDGGTGLGLSIARNTLRSHGGDVTLWSQVGVGSTFTLHFPIHETVTVK